MAAVRKQRTPKQLDRVRPSGVERQNLGGGMIEYETPIDRFLTTPKPAQSGSNEQRAELIARGDFSNPADHGLDRAVVRHALARRILGRG